jgi:hypothetical protein
MGFNIHDIVHSSLFEKTNKDFLRVDHSEMIPKRACYVFRREHEDFGLIRRVIVFPPHGFTSEETSLLDAHPEARKARVRILGAVDPAKKGFKPLSGPVEFDFSLARNIPTEGASTYARFSENCCGSLLKSWRNWFYVVRENGRGNFHNLTNLSDEWVLALLEKHLADNKTINIKPYLEKLPESQSKTLQGILQKIIELGGSILNSKTSLLPILKFPPGILIPILIQMLNVKEAGRHEPCTFFALLLKIAKERREMVLEEVARGMELELAPHFYLDDLHRKLCTSYFRRMSVSRGSAPFTGLENTRSCEQRRIAQRLDMQFDSTMF